MGDFEGGLTYSARVGVRYDNAFAENAMEYAVEIREALAQRDTMAASGLVGIPRLKSLQAIAHLYGFPLNCDSCVMETYREIVEAGFTDLDTEMTDDERIDTYQHMFMAYEELRLHRERRELWARFAEEFPDKAERWLESPYLSGYAS